MNEEVKKAYHKGYDKARYMGKKELEEFKEWHGIVYERQQGIIKALDKVHWRFMWIASIVWIVIGFCLGNIF